MIRFKDILKLTQGTKLSGLSNKQMSDAIIGQFPISHGLNELKMIHLNSLRKVEQNWKLSYLEVDLLLDGMLVKIFESKLSQENKNNQIEKVETIRNFNKESYQARVDVQYLQEMVNDCQTLIVDYESKLRVKDLEIENLKKEL